MSIEVIVGAEGFKEIVTVRVPKGSAAREIVVAVAAQGGFPGENAFLFVEDAQEPIDLAVVIDEKLVGDKILHVNRARQVAVAVAYNGSQKTMDFPPSSRVQTILDWAVGPDGFKIDAALAPEMELALQGTTDALPKSDHIGKYVEHPDFTLALDIVRGVIPNGGPDGDLSR